MRNTFCAATIAALCLLASPVSARDASQDLPHYVPVPAPYGSAQAQPGFDPAARDAWLADCRQRVGSRDSGVGGALIGGAIGGLAGNRIAGRGNRTVGTIAGAAVGAVAGAAIDKSEDRARARDECEAYLDDYYARYTQSAGTYGGYGAGYAYPANAPTYGYAAQGCCMSQPVAMVPVAQPQCTETVEYVYEDVPVRPARRTIPRRAKAVPDKRVKITPTS
ncbi:MAG: glycine zipper 2TM domain-containing protein [Novosphingobium sp.]|uniref:glycine zipper 2TM domain-containing protein n=1 Tax=Novosphingobium sp. TaxID=1874826 RepID=UPI0012D1F333|nr:glycine zipper 2TM domain-containing protein [Novosphingobium sp.]MPS67438.1 glycine zipper 2TM domain-containing protein [Novosphingobium sp.]